MHRNRWRWKENNAKPMASCRPLLLLPSVFPSTRVFSNELVLRIKWPKYWSFSFSISPSNEYSRLISFRIDWSPYHPRDSQESSPELWRNFNISPSNEYSGLISFRIDWSPCSPRDSHTKLLLWRLSSECRTMFTCHTIIFFGILSTI